MIQALGPSTSIAHLHSAVTTRGNSEWVEGGARMKQNGEAPERKTPLAMGVTVQSESDPS